MLLNGPPSPRALELLWEKLSTPGQEYEPEPVKVAEKPSQPKAPVKRPKPKGPVKRPEPMTQAIDGQTKDRVMKYDVCQVFKDASPREQRMNVWQLMVDGSQVKQVTLPTGAYGSDVIYPEPLRQPVYTMGEEQYGVVQKELFTDRYIELPGLYPHQTITRLSTVPAIHPEQLEVIRDRGTGQLLVRLKGQARPIVRKVKLHYVVKRQNTSPNAEENLPACPGTPLSRLIDNEQLEQFDQTRPAALMEALTAWGREFKADKDISASADSDILTEVIRQRQGACRHRAWVVYAIATARGVPVRLVTSHMHEWIEYSPDRGRTWEKVDLGGANADSEVHIKKPAFKQSARGLIFSPQEVEVLLPEAKSDPGSFADRIGTSPAAVKRWIASEGKAPLEIDNFATCYGKLLDPPYSLSNLRKAVGMVKSGVIDDEIFSHFKPKLSQAFAEVLKHSVSRAESESTLEYLYELKDFFKGTENKSARQHWFEFLREINVDLSLDIYDLRYRAIIYQRKFELWSYGVLKKNLLGNLAVEDILTLYIMCTSNQEYLTEHQLNAILPEITGKIYKLLEPYYLSIKAPALKRLKAAPKAIATPEMQGLAPSFEQRLKTTCIGSGFTWLPEGEVMVGRLLKQLAPFREQKASVTTKKVKLIQNIGAVIRGQLYQKKLQSAFQGEEGFCDLLEKQISSQFNPSEEEDEELYMAWMKIQRFAFQFSLTPTMERMERLQTVITSSGIEITPGISALLGNCLNSREKAINAVCKLPQSFAGYLAKQSKAESGHLGLYSLAKDKAQRGYQPLTSKEAILEADSQAGPFLPLPVSLIKKHLQEEDSESLFINSVELQYLIREFCEHLRFEDV